MQIWNLSQSFTRPNNTTAYASGQLVANSATAGLVVPMAFTVGGNSIPGQFRLSRIRLFKSGTSNSNAQFRLHLYAASPTVANGSSPPVVFPVVTDGNTDIVATYGMFAPGAHGELLIDRQGYIRAIWREDVGGMPRAAAVQSQVEKLNEEKSPPPFPDDHVH